MNIGSAYLTDDEATEVARALLVAAKARGYCDEANNVLTDVGFSIPSDRKRVTIVVEVDGNFRTDLHETYNWNLSHDHIQVERGDFSVVSVEDADEPPAF